MFQINDLKFGRSSSRVAIILILLLTAGNVEAAAVEGGRYVGKAGDGQFLKRGTCVSM